MPRTRAELEALPGVGRKTANVVLNTAFGEDTIAVDTHIFRVANRTGMAPGKDVRAVEDADILIDYAWIPEFCFTCTDANRTRLRPILSWGVRYDLAPWAQLQSGVRVPDIGDANLLDAQIFGQLTLINRSIERVVDRRRRR